MLSALLAERERQGKPIRVGIIGAGKFGGGLVAQNRPDERHGRLGHRRH